MLASRADGHVMATRVHALEPAHGVLQLALVPRPMQLLAGLGIVESDLEAIHT